MKRIIAILLLCSVLLMSFTGCAYVSNNGESEETGKEICRETDQETSGEEKKGVENDKSSTVLQFTDEAVVALIEYLRQNYETLYPFESFDTVATHTLAESIDKIKSGERALLVNYQSSETYFICGYHKKQEATPIYDYINEFTWVKFENANQITETYNDMHFIFAYQFNKASSVKDIITIDADVPNAEYFQYYEPSFNEGVNINDDLVLDQMFLYVRSIQKDTMFLSTHNNSLLFAYIDGQYYIKILCGISYTGDRLDYDPHRDLGEYHDVIMDDMIFYQYSVTDIHGNIYNWGLIRFKDFASIVN